MTMKVYEAILSHPANIAQARRAQPAIEQAGGKIKFEQPTASGMVLVTLILPDRYSPQDFVPGLPFYLV